MHNRRNFKARRSHKTTFKWRKIVGFRGFAPDPTGGAHSAPPDPLAVSGPLPTVGPTSVLIYIFFLGRGGIVMTTGGDPHH